MQLNRVVLPSRFHTKTATKLLASEAEIKKINEQTLKVYENCFKGLDNK